LSDIEGAYSTIGITDSGELFAFRDSIGIKPLSVGYSQDKDIIAISSESIGLDINDLNYFHSDVEPGELVIVSDEGVSRKRIVQLDRKALCSFEFAYFARPDSILNGASEYVYKIRQKFGRNLGKTCLQKGNSVKPDVIIPLPESANNAGYGFHEETKIPLEAALRRHRYVTDRAFITTKKDRSAILDKKINVVKSMIFGKKIALIDDSIVRGDTTTNVVKKIRDAGAKAIHIYITFPKIISPCPYGIDMATFGELIGAKHNPSEIATIIGADSVQYQSFDDFIKAIGLKETELCLACITGNYPTPLAQRIVDEKRRQYKEGVEEIGRIYE